MDFFWYGLLVGEIDQGEIDQGEIDEGKFYGKCSIDGFITYYTSIANGELSIPSWVDGLHLTVFCHHKGSEADPIRNYNRALQSVTGTDLEMLQEKIKSVMKSVKFWSDSILLQFWAPIQIIGQNHKVLTLLGQPFGLVRPLYKGLCRYRKRCLVHNNIAHYGNGEDSQLGPPGRVFKRGYPEFCPNIEAYTTQEFPLRDYAVRECGIKGYWALPLFELCEQQQQQQQCLGVLEFVAMKTTNAVREIYPLFLALEEANLKCSGPYFHECNQKLYLPTTSFQIRNDILSLREDLKKVLDLVREVHHLPLIQAWLPCMCHDPDTYVGYAGSSCRYPDECKTTELFCDMSSCDRTIEYVSDIVDFKHKYVTISVRNGKCLIGKAYALNKPCFSRDTSHFSISDYPFVHLTRRAGLTACFAIPLQFIHPKLDALFLEIFLSPEQLNCNYDANVVATLKSLLFAVAQGFSRLNVSLELKQGEEFSVDVSHSDDEFLYFDICRSAGNLNRHDEGLENTSREELQLQSSHPSAMIEMNATNDKTNAVVTKQHSSVTHSRILERLEPSRRVYGNSEAITLDVLELHFGRNLVDAANCLGVSRSTLKRICRGVGIIKWPSHKRKKVDHHIHTSPRFPIGSILDVGREVIQESAGGHEIIHALEKEAAAPVPTIVNGNSRAPRDEIGNKDTMIVKATCREEIVKFPLSCKSGIEYLSHEIAKRFKLEVGSFTIKYEDEDSDWIMIPCDEDLRYRMETLKSLGQSSIKLSVFPVTP